MRFAFGSTVFNNLSSPINLGIYTSGVIKSWITIPDNLSVSSGSSMKLNFTITVPIAKPGGVYTGEILMNADGGGNMSIPLSVIVPENKLITVTPAEISFSTRVNITNKVYVNITNNGNTKIQNAALKSFTANISGMVTDKRSGFPVMPRTSELVYISILAGNGTADGWYNGSFVVDADGILNTVRLNIEVYSLPNLTSWHYKKEITINNTGGELTEYQVPVSLNRDNFNYMRASDDGADIRFTYFNSTKGEEWLIPYWIESWNTSGDSRIWVKVPHIPGNGLMKVYMYSGNAGALSESDGDKTFELFDDFEGTSLDTNKWTSFNTGQSGSVSVSDGYLVIGGGDNNNRGLKSKIIVPSNGKEIMGKYWVETSNNNGIDGDPTVAFYANDTSLKDWGPHLYLIYHMDESIIDGVTINVNDGSDVLNWTTGGRIPGNYDARGRWSKEGISRIGNNFYGNMIGENGTILTKDWRYTESYNFDNVNIPVVFANNLLLKVKFDWVFIRKYIFPEPFVNVSADKPVFTVDDDGSAMFTKIQDAINNATTKDTVILVHSGTYYERVEVNKQVILKGIDNGGGKPVINGNGWGNAIKLSMGNSTLDGFTITNPPYGNAGINVVSNNNIIRNNTVLTNWYGIYLVSSSPHFAHKTITFYLFNTLT